MQQTTLTERIKLLRNALKLSQTDFGKKLGKNYHSVMRWELGKVLPPANVIEHICSTFGVNALWLEKGIGEIFLYGESSSLGEKESVQYSDITEIPYFKQLPGDFSPYRDYSFAEHIKFPSSKSKMFAVSAPADCASPIMPGDIVIFSTDVTDNIDGKLCIIKNKYDECLIRWIHNNMLVSKKTEYPDIALSDSIVIGIVDEIYRNIIF